MLFARPVGILECYPYDDDDPLEVYNQFRMRDLSFIGVNVLRSWKTYFDGY